MEGSKGGVPSWMGPNSFPARLSRPFPISRVNLGSVRQTEQMPHRRFTSLVPERKALSAPGAPSRGGWLLKLAVWKEGCVVARKASHDRTSFWYVLSRHVHTSDGPVVISDVNRGHRL